LKKKWSEDKKGKMKAKERIEKYGIEAYIKMLGKETVKKRGGKAALIKFYKKKYPKAPIKVVTKTGKKISKSMRKYWNIVKKIAEGHKISIEEARKIYKEQSKKGKIRLVKKGRGYQLYLKGEYEYKGEKKTEFQKKLQICESYSHFHKKKSYNKMLTECVHAAQGILGGYNWELVRIIKTKWIRFYGYKKR
jgi:hypothetical protein